MSRRPTVTLYARVPPEVDAIRDQLQERLAVPLPELVARSFLALRDQLDNQRSASEPEAHHG
jgi:hypothetical protein